MKNPIKLIQNKRKYRKSKDYRYRRYWYDLAVDHRAVLIESGRGETVNGNMFALLRELEQNPRWAEYQPYFVITGKTQEEAEVKIRHYGFSRVRTVIRESDEYLRLLASCGFFFSDNTYPAIFCKKTDQVFANTWHGTPLKKMGKSNLAGARGIGNVQRNYFMADYSLFPNEFTRDVFLDDYMLRNQYRGRIVSLDYPRNDALYDDSMRASIRKELRLDGTQVIAYMPTWRGGNANDVQTSRQIEIITGYLRAIDGLLSPGQQFYVNLHPFVANSLEYDQFRNIHPFPKKYETYDFLGACDALVTDYSSVMFDYAGTGRKVSLFTYDLEEYLEDRGVYMEVEGLPFDLCRTPEALMDSLSAPADTDAPEYRAFVDRFCPYRTKGLRCSEQFLDLVLLGAREEALCSTVSHEQRTHVIAVSKLSGSLTPKVRSILEKRLSEGFHVTLAFEGGIREEALAPLEEFLSYENTDFYSLIGGIRDEDMPREVQRIFPGWQIDTYNKGDEMRRTAMRLIHHLVPVRSYRIRKEDSELVAEFREPNLSYLDHAKLAEQEYPLHRNGDHYTIRIPIEDLLRFKTRNRILLVDRFGIEHKIIAGRKLSKILKIMHTRMIRLSPDMVCYLQEYIGSTDIIIRQNNYTDRLSERIKLAFAYCAAKLLKPKAPPIFLYEKNSERYEESASILYEKLLDQGYDNACYILKKDCPQWSRVPVKYRKNIVPKYSFRHYLKLFQTRTIIASETITHNIDLRPISPFLRYWIQHGGFNYLFLQHGVMYMISLDAENRAFFKQKVREGFVNRTVVSSQREADHFIQIGGVDPKELYICGLLKFDRSVRLPEHDRIVIMPTWRPWESVLAAEDFRKTSYYRFTERIYQAIPEEWKDRTVILPHPLIKQHALEANDRLMAEHMRPDLAHDDVLKITDTLITDYSSISYDAFYRGCNIIFYWEEKDECVSHYGDTAKLMLTEELAFGAVCYDSDALCEAVRETYGQNQDPVYQERFRKIVTYHDGRNTERFIEMAKGEGLI